MNTLRGAGPIRSCSGSVSSSDRPPSYRETNVASGKPYYQSPKMPQLPHGGNAMPTGQPRSYGSTSAANNSTTPVVQRNTYPDAPFLPLHFTMRHEPEGGPGRTAVVSAVMCALIAGTDNRLFNGTVFENVSWLAVLFLSGASKVLFDLVWSVVIATLTAFIFPLNVIAFLIGVDWIIPGRPISFLVAHSQETVSVFFYLIALLGLGWMPPLLPVRWAIDWALGYLPRIEHRQSA